MAARNITLRISKVESTCKNILQKLGAPQAIAKRVVEALVNNELGGYPSHGLLRLLEYTTLIRNNSLNPAIRPTIKRQGQFGKMIDGRRGFGILAADKISHVLCKVLAKEPIAIIGLRNTHNLGRLGTIIKTPAEQGHIVMAFANYQGAGQNVLPWGGTSGRLSPNPLAFGFPRPSLNPLLVDMTTSTVPEGKLRLAMLQGRRVPKGWLVNNNWKSIKDPGAFYRAPQRAFLPPLGGSLGHKGFALGLVVEILAGIVTGAGYSQEKPSIGGNGGFFIGIRSTILGQTMDQVLSDTETLVDYCRTAPSINKKIGVRIPGEESSMNVQLGRTKGVLKFHRAIWDQINQIEAELSSMF